MKKKHKKGHHEEEMNESWLLPYSDLMTLLLAVFIVLFAVSQTDQTKLEAMANSFRKTLMQGGAGIMNEEGDSILSLYPSDTEVVDITPPPEAENIPEEDIRDFFEEEELENLEELQRELLYFFKEEGMLSDVGMHIDERGLIISLNNAILFDSGSAEIKPENIDSLIKIGTRINKLDNYINIEGHTDSVPVRGSSIYPSNWELSCARASSVVRLMVVQAGIDDNKLAPTGFAHTRPVGDNRTEEGRAKNRRIDIIILNTRLESLVAPVTDIPTE